MRYVDIYLDSKTPVAFDGIQIGEVVLTRTPNARRFIMSDGTPCMYPSAKDAATITLRLECSSKDAAAIARSARYGSLIIAGMSYGTNRRQNPHNTAAYLPEQTGIIGYLTGEVDITEISSCADLYNVSIPLQLLVDASGEPERTDVPAVKIGALYIDGKLEKLANYRYRKTGTFVRRQVIEFHASEISVRCSAAVPDGAALRITVERDGELLLEGGAELDGMLPLYPGENHFVLTAAKADDPDYKPQIVWFTVYREFCVLGTADGLAMTTENGAFLRVKEEA